MKLACRTRGNAAPQGKPRVYFTGHPADLEPYSKDIFSDILHTQNCAIYYDEQPDAPFDQEELLRTLEEMQLVVIPVTSRFLYVPNRAREVELPFAVERHIPVLPLMQEQGLEADFNEKCGDLQLLSKRDQNAAMISYPEKLQRFLGSVLMGDSLAARVRAAFQAYIFLSYRKKDRKYAHELMKLIHQNDFCRDVAIWYDEFLMPGEDFTSSIRKAMDKSSLITMVITPNMVNENNYVIEHEYPDARRADKPILPVEMAPTDREALRASFPGIPETVPAGDRAALAEGLRAGLRGVSTRPAGPEQNYLMGLAYLNGIDVEVDKNRAAELITGAAEAGLPEAMERLADMYRRGNGVPRSYRAAVQWQERLADWRQAQFEQDDTRENALMWALALCGLGKCQEELGSLPAAVGTYTRLTEISGQFAERYGSMAAVSCQRFGYERLGSISMREDRLDEAESCFLRELETAEWLNEAAEFPTGEYQTAARYIAPRGDPAGCYIRLGQVCQARGQMDKAREYLLKSLEIFQRLYEEDANAGTRKDLADAYRSLGNFSRDASVLDKAREYLLKSLELSRQLYEETGTIEVQGWLLMFYFRLGQICAEEGRTDEAKAYCLEGIGLGQQGDESGKQTRESVGNIMIREVHAAFYNALGDVLAKEDRQEDAGKRYLQALELLRRLTEDIKDMNPPAPFYDLSLVYYGLSRVTGDKAKAKEYYLRGMELSQQLREKVGNADCWHGLSMGYRTLAALLAEEGDAHQAVETYEKALRISEKICDTLDSGREYQDGMAESAFHIGLLARWDAALQKTMLTQAHDIWTRLSERCPEVPDYARQRGRARAELDRLAAGRS